jgi:hypothetical protein
MRRRGLGTVLVGLGAALATILAYETRAGNALFVSLLSKLSREAYDNVAHTWLGMLAWRTLSGLAGALLELTGPLLTLSALVTIACVVARSVAWARVRDGKADPLDRLRSHPRVQRALTSTPAALAAALSALALVGDFAGIATSGAPSFFLREALANLMVSGAIVGLLHALSRAGMRALLAPVESEAAAPKAADDIVFSAVAVTARTRAAVGGLAVATVAMVLGTLFGANNPLFVPLLVAYLTGAVTAPFVLRRASRIAIGIDGVWVRDASRTRFFAYRDLDAVRARGADVELVHGDRAVLRLQLHGEDAGRRDEVITRIGDALARSRDASTRGTEMVVQALSTARVRATSVGVDGYRTPSVSREQLWELVEGSTTDASTRTAAAQALAYVLDDADRARLRVAAARCAEPRTRVELGVLAREEAAEAEAAEEEVLRRPAR